MNLNETYNLLFFSPNFKLLGVNRDYNFKDVIPVI